MGIGIIAKTSIVSVNGIMCIRGIFKKKCIDGNTTISFYTNVNEMVYVPQIPHFESSVPVGGRHLKMFRNIKYDVVASVKNVDLTQFDTDILFEDHASYNYREKSNISEISFVASGTMMNILHRMCDPSIKNGYIKGDVYVRITTSMLSNRTNTRNSTMYVVAAKVEKYTGDTYGDECTPENIALRCIKNIYTPVDTVIEHGNIPTMLLRKPEDGLMPLFNIANISDAADITCKTYVNTSIIPIFSSLSLLDEQFELLDSIRKFDVRFDYALPEEDIKFISSYIITPRPMVDFKQYVLFVVTMFMYNNIENTHEFCNNIWVRKYFEITYPDRNYISFVTDIIDAIYPLCDNRGQYNNVIMFLYVYLDIDVAIDAEKDIDMLASLYDAFIKGYEPGHNIMVNSIRVIDIYPEHLIAHVITDNIKNHNCIRNTGSSLNNICIRFWIVKIVRRMVESSYMPTRISCTCIEEFLLPYKDRTQLYDMAYNVSKHYGGWSYESVNYILFNHDTDEYLSGLKVSTNDIKLLFEISFENIISSFISGNSVSHIIGTSISVLLNVLSIYTLSTETKAVKDDMFSNMITNDNKYRLMYCNAAIMYYNDIQPIMSILFKSIKKQHKEGDDTTRRLFTNSIVRLLEIIFANVIDKPNSGISLTYKDSASFLGYISDRDYGVFVYNNKINTTMSQFIPDIGDYVLRNSSENPTIQKSVEYFEQTYPRFFKFLINLFAELRCDSQLEPKEAAMVLAAI